MRIEQLQQVISIASIGSINKAAQEMFLSQSNLSQSLKSLESEIGRPIFIRKGGGVELTPFGREFIAYAEATCSQFNLLNNFCAEKEEPARRFSVASYYMRFTHSLFIKLYERYDGQRTRFSFFECSFPDIVENVRNQRAELGVLLISQKQRKLTIQMFKNKGLVYKPFAQYPVAVTVGPNNPYFSSSSDGVTMAGMSRFPLVMYRDTYFDFTSELEELGLGDQLERVTVSDRSSMHEFIRATDAFSIAAYTNAYSSIEYYDRIRALRLLDRNVTLELGYIYNVSRPLSDIAEEYIRMLKDALRV